MKLVIGGKPVFSQLGPGIRSTYTIPAVKTPFARPPLPKRTLASFRQQIPPHKRARALVQHGGFWAPPVSPVPAGRGLPAAMPASAVAPTHALMPGGFVPPPTHAQGTRFVSQGHMTKSLPMQDNRSQAPQFAPQFFLPTAPWGRFEPGAGAGAGSGFKQGPQEAAIPTITGRAPLTATSIGTGGGTKQPADLSPPAPTQAPSTPAGKPWSAGGGGTPLILVRAPPETKPKPSWTRSGGKDPSTAFPMVQTPPTSTPTVTDTALVPTTWVGDQPAQSAFPDSASAGGEAAPVSDDGNIGEATSWKPGWGTAGLVAVVGLVLWQLGVLGGGK